MSKYKQALSFIVGAGAGLITGLLTAPRSGKKTRQKLANDLDEFKHNVEKTTNRKLEEAKEILNDQVDKQVKKGKATVDKMRKATKF